MGARLAFRYDIRFTLAAGERYDTAPFEATLRAEMFKQGWHFYMGALGGMAATYGIVFREPTGDMTTDDVETLAVWLRRQPIRATVQLGILEPLDQTDVRTPVVGQAFTVGAGSR